MSACVPPICERTSPSRFPPGDLSSPHFLSAAGQRPDSTAYPAERIHELAQAYEISLRLQDALRPLMPKVVWYYASDAAGQHPVDWPLQELTATVMFTDIVAFTALMEAHPVQKVLDSLNGYFALLSQIVQRRRGDVLKFLGDGLMALFICPADAVKAGREIQRAVAAFNGRQAAQGQWRFETRLAIDTGQVVLASVGAPDRQDYTLFGRPVNLAAHLAERATPGTVWISQHAYGRLADKDGLAPRGVPVANCEQRPTVVYEMACP